MDSRASASHSSWCMFRKHLVTVILLPFTNWVNVLGKPQLPNQTPGWSLQEDKEVHLAWFRYRGRRYPPQPQTSLTSLILMGFALLEILLGHWRLIAWFFGFFTTVELLEAVILTGGVCRDQRGACPAYSVVTFNKQSRDAISSAHPLHPYYTLQCNLCYCSMLQPLDTKSYKHLRKGLPMLNFEESMQVFVVFT